MPEFLGQKYVNTSTTPKTIYIAIALNPTTGWQRISNYDHKHIAEDVAGLDAKVIELVNANGIQMALTTLMGESNVWEGDLNNFLGELRVKNYKVLTNKEIEAPMIEPAANSVIGWTGSGWGPVTLKTGSVDTGAAGPDYSNLLTKTDVVDDLVSARTNEPLSAAQGLALKEMIQSGYAPKGHTHAGYAPVNHVHSDYIGKTATDNVMETGISFQGVSTFLFADATEGGRFAFGTGALADTPHTIEVDGVAGVQKSLYMGGSSETTAKELILNFEQVRIPSGKIVTDAESGRIIFSPIRIESASGNPTQYVTNSSSREYGAHLNNTSMVGVNQIVFSKPSTSVADAILFPKSFAGNSMSSEIGYYNYLYMIDDRIKTDATLDSKKNYIVLDGRKIFFSNADPGRDAEPGDVWLKI